MPKKITADEYNKIFKKQAGNNYILLSEYQGALKPVKVKHLKCGTIYNVTPTRFREGSRCPICVYYKRRLTPEEYIKRCKEKGYDPPIEDYVNSQTKIKHKCKNGHIYEQKPNDHLNGKGCRYCYHNYRLSSKQHYDTCNSKSLDLPVNKYVNSRSKIMYKCKKGHIYEQTPSNHLQGYGCSKCKESHGEKFIRNYLDINDIKYITQKTFKDLKDKTYLSYDFYLPDYNILIEYQGIQHYESIKFNGKDGTDLETQQYHDKLKKEYAKKNHYKLLTLHYSLDTQEKVDKYLERRIKD